MFVGKHRQADSKNCAATIAVAADDIAKVLADNSVTRAKAKADALANRLGGVKRVEDSLRLLQSGSVVGEFDFNGDRLLRAR